MKKKMQLWEKESNEILKVKNLCIGSDMIKKHTRVHFAPIKTLLLSKNGNSSNQNFVAERVETLHFAVWTNQNLVAGQKV